MDLFSMEKPHIKLKTPIKLFEAFAGIGTQAMALKRITKDVEVVGISEIEKYAIGSYMAIHGDTNNYGDIMKINGADLPKIDIFTWSFPCTDLSKAGKQKGLVDTRSGLGYQVIRIVSEMAVKPKVLIMENVPDLLSKKFKHDWHAIYNGIQALGYTNHVDTLNAKRYGVAQNRDRVFMVSVLGDYRYDFPKPIKLEKRLKDYLEDVVDEKYYLSKKIVNYFKENSKKQAEKGNGFKFSLKEKNDIANSITTRSGGRMDDNFLGDKSIKIGSLYGDKQAGSVFDKDGLSPTLTTSSSENWNILLGERSISIPEATKKGYALAKDGSDNIANAVLTHDKKNMVAENVETLRIRKLTPKECWRLMGISDEDFEKAQAVNSNSRLYEQAGNAIVVDVFEAILRQIIEVD